ncbi:hypothetical protein CEXT_136701 [Caerostris extrusa]|uniref:Uncharacterized protein n=1 Tax=Caerostris extrusa TaxID=172846 RepID=A0AAV4YG27_CAEEX|nr:hypothetical protein CEXT_136701 [Caerostris extrusa]
MLLRQQDFNAVKHGIFSAVRHLLSQSRKNRRPEYIQPEPSLQKACEREHKLSATCSLFKCLLCFRDALTHAWAFQGGRTKCNLFQNLSDAGTKNRKCL